MLSHPRPLLDNPAHDLSVHHSSVQPALYHVAPHPIPQNSIHHHPFPIPAPHFDPRLSLDAPHDLHHPPQNQTCVPALIPPGMDPSQVDIRTFYPYTPNEVKHRKRTTRAQLKVLEGVYKYDTKPNASLRKKLAAELDMTPRGVQVWFQNRRAKTKQQAKKAEAAAATGSSKPTTVDGVAGTSPSNPPIAPRPEVDGDDDHKELDEDALSPAPSSPQPRSEETAPEDGDRMPPVSSDAANSNVSENDHLNSTSDSRRGSIAPSHPLPSWATSSPSASSPVSAPQPATAPTSANASSSSAVHVNSHVRLTTHPPSATAYSNNHLAPPDVYAQRRTSLPVASLSPHAASRLGLGQKRGFDPSRRRLSSDVSGHGGHRMLAHPYMHVATTANGSNGYNDGNDSAHHPPMRRPQLMARMSAPFPLGAHQNHLHPGHPHGISVVPSQGRPPLHHSYDVSGMPASPQAMYGQGPPLGYDHLAPRHSIDGSALGLVRVHPHMDIGMQQQLNGGMAEGYGMDMNVGPLDQRGYVISQRLYTPPVPGPLPSPGFSFGNPFGPSSSSDSSSNSASGTPPNGASPPLLSLPRRPSEGGVSDADTEESSAGPLSRFGSVASLGGGSEVSWTSAYTSESGLVEGVAAEEGNICASRRESCASGQFLERFSDLEVGSNGGTPAPPSLHEQHQHQLRHASSSSHLSPGNYPPHHVPAHPPGGQVPQTPTDGDDGYPSPSSASTISAGSAHTHLHTALEPANQHGHVVNGNGARIGQGHSRTNNTSSELAFALQDAPAKGDIGHMQYPDYGSNGGETVVNEHGYPQYAQDQAHHPQADYAKGQGHFPTVYEGYVYPSPGDGQMATGNEAYAAGAIELSHMCVPASEGVHFMGGYMQYS